MGCRTCGGSARSSKRFTQGIPILDANGNKIADNYEKLQSRFNPKPKRVRLLKQPSQPNVSRDNYPNLITIPSSEKRVNVLTYDSKKSCIYIIGYMEGCGSCNYMRRLLNKLMTPEVRAKVTTYILDKRITDPTGFQFAGNPTILFIDKGKLVFQVGGVYNDIMDKIVYYFMR